ncbi:hypothetical protein M378DRAFT_29560, partial [Amanita muscaria Koide BX008]
AGAVNIAEVEVKAAQAREVELSVGAISLNDDEPEDGLESGLEGGSEDDGDMDATDHDPNHTDISPGRRLQALFCSHFGCTQPGCHRFTASKYGDRHYKVTDWEELDYEYLVHEKELSLPDLNAEYIIDLNDHERYVAVFEGQYRGSNLHKPGMSHPARRWLQEGFANLGQRHEGWKRIPDFSVDVCDSEGGYLVILDPGYVDIFFPFAFVTEEGFSIYEWLDRAWAEYGLQVLEHREFVQTFVRVGSVTMKQRSRKKSAKETEPESVERTSMHIHDFKRVVPKPIVITVKINGQPVRALVDCGSEADFISTTVVDQLRLKRDILAKPLNIRLAVHGSRSKTNASATVNLKNFQYQEIDEQ